MSVDLQHPSRNPAERDARGRKTTTEHVRKLLPIHEAQLLTYLKLTKCCVGLLINYNVTVLKDGIKRMVL